ncbi:phosphoglucan phosphatase DSP4, amyloplastic isoform X2 [Physcomitrium patens]|uniref:phosphoglucan phosphatase DSP4, amyloplastic isoform X2 n=1 Tax=Physcomitrium patens TaxID=3218 RepID=UPI000D15915E|nr:phosphoglucan phosphatase DSP4, amyloplastic-like isoform X2 [Physcomitrium patens]|eukprot:XP_024399194.1 phosphoglucan phosphatase DSP4, amyloplastic-like isoform X2 [Physcomitrella patens]
MAMAAPSGMLSSKAHLREYFYVSSSSISRSSGAGKSLQVSFAKPLCTSTQWANLRKRGSVHPRQCVAPQMQSTDAGAKTEENVEEKTEEYSATMQQAMGTSLEYRHELGMNYAHVLPDLIVGSCLQTPADADKLQNADVGVVFCLQQDPDLAYFGVDLSAIQRRVNELDGITHYRCEIRDFDPYDLRMRLPVAVAKLHQAIEANKGKTAYVHCTAGLGRAPGVALAYMYWLRGLSLKEANVLLQKVRRCHPKLDSIRAATADLLTDGEKQVVELRWWSGPKHVEIAGLDKLPLEYRQNENQWVLRREVPVGRYEYKYVVDGVWMTNSESPMSHPNREGQVNNVLEVTDSGQNVTTRTLRERLMQEDADLTAEERIKIRAKLEEIAITGKW